MSVIISKYGRAPEMFLIGCTVLTWWSPVSARQPDSPASSVTSPPAELRLDAFYTKYISSRDIPIVSSGKVPDKALIEARRIVDNMLAKKPELAKVLVKNRVRIAVMAASERTTDIPEHSDLRPREHWDKRARGLGATRTRPACSCAEENLLAYRNDPYRGENILIHEFAHTLHELAIVEVDETFDARLRSTYASAMKRGLWANTYAATNHKEYWAEGVQSWLNANREVSRGDGIHNGINTHRELRDYDPDLASLISEWFHEPPESESP